MEDDRNPKLSGHPVTTVEDRDYRWNPHNSYPDTYPEAVSPTSATHSGSVSPVRHRGSTGNGLSNATRATESQNTSPYLSRQAPTQAFVTRASAQIPAEQFTYSHAYASKPPVDNAVNMALYRRDSVTNTDSLKSKYTPRDFQIQTSTTQPSSLYDTSLPPSRGSDYHDVDHAPDYFAAHRGSRGESQLDSNARLSIPNNLPLYPSHLSNSYDDTLQALSKYTSNLNLDNRTSSNIYSNGFAYDKHTLGLNNSMNNFVRKNMQTSTSHSPPTRSNFVNGRQDGADHVAVDSLSLSNRRSYAINNTLDHSANHNLPSIHQYSNYAPYHGQLYGPSYAPQYTSGIVRPQETQPYRNMNDQYGFQGLAPYYSTGPPPRNLPRDVCHGLRSQILEDFRNNTKSNKAFTLRDVYGHIVEFSGDQHGSRWIQQKLEVANSDEKSHVFEEILVNINQLTTDIFGNYVIQKLYERGDQVQKKLLAQQMRGHVRELSTHSYGCRVVQTALDHVLADQQIEIVKELQKDILKCVKDQNGNHVVQKAIEKVPLEHIQFIIDAFKGQVYALSTHNYGCRVMQRMLSHCDQPFLLEELFACAPALIAHEYGNYVIQHIIQQGKAEDRARIINLVNQQLLTFCKSKFASNVVECAMVHSTDEQRHSIMKTMISLSSDGSNTLQILMKDQFGNYVVREYSTFSLCSNSPLLNEPQKNSSHN